MAVRINPNPRANPKPSFVISSAITGIILVEPAMPPTIKTLDRDRETKASQHHGHAARGVLHRSQSFPPGNGFGLESTFGRDAGECSTA
jgi:hypothetical protein